MKCTFDWKQTTQWSFDIPLFWINHMFYLNKTTVAGPPKNAMEATYKTHPLGMHLWLSLLFLILGNRGNKQPKPEAPYLSNKQTNKQRIKQTNKPINQPIKQAKTNLDKQLAISFRTFNSFGKNYIILTSRSRWPVERSAATRCKAWRNNKKKQIGSHNQPTTHPPNQPTTHPPNQPTTQPTNQPTITPFIGAIKPIY